MEIVVEPPAQPSGGPARALVAAFCVLLVALSLGRSRTDAASATVLIRTPDGGIQPDLATDASGALSLLYFKGDPAAGDLYYVRLDADLRASPAIRVNSRAGSAIATGSIRGGQIATGRNGRVHVAWPGSTSSIPRGPEGTAPMFYTRLLDGRTQFEPERNLARVSRNLDGGAIAADADGRVYVAWHAAIPGGTDESARRLWIARSSDDGRTFGQETSASDPAVGACGCCGVRAIVDRRETLYVLFRSAADLVHRDTYLLTSRDHGERFRPAARMPGTSARAP